jgi:uncharacterized protein (TIGR02246 family)
VKSGPGDRASVRHLHRNDLDAGCLDGSVHFFSPTHPGEEARMRITPLFPVILLVVLMAMACPLSAQQRAPIRSADQVRADTETLVATWVTRANAGDATRVAATYTNDAVFVDPYGNVVRGRAAIQEYFGQSFATRSSNWESRVDETVMIGDLAVAYGTWFADIEGLPAETPGPWRWLSVGVYETDGSLRTRFHIGMIPAAMPGR